jgi:hypothetical protein
MKRQLKAEAAICRGHAETNNQIASRPSSAQRSETVEVSGSVLSSSIQAKLRRAPDEIGEFGGNPARTVHKRGLQKKVHRQSCTKAAGIVDTEALGESIILVAGEVDPRVQWITPQPVTFDLNTGEFYPTKAALFEALQGKRYKPWIYTPDFLFELTSGQKVFVEGKHTRWLQSSETFGSVRRAMFELGHRLSVVTEREFSRALHRNLRILRALQDRTLDPAKHSLLKSAAQDQFSAGAARRLFGFTQTEICTSLLEGFLKTDLARTPLSDRTKLSRANGDVTHLQVLPL